MEGGRGWWGQLGRGAEGPGVRDGVPGDGTCPVAGPVPKPAGKDCQPCHCEVAGPRHPGPPPVGVGGNGWRCSYMYIHVRDIF